MYVDKECVDKECVDKECVDKECVDKECVDKECVDKECVDTGPTVEYAGTSEVARSSKHVGKSTKRVRTNVKHAGATSKHAGTWQNTYTSVPSFTNFTSLTSCSYGSVADIVAKLSASQLPKSYDRIFTPRLPRKRTVDVAFTQYHECHACHAKRRWM